MTDCPVLVFLEGTRTLLKPMMSSSHSDAALVGASPKTLSSVGRAADVTKQAAITEERKDMSTPNEAKYELKRKELETSTSPRKISKKAHSNKFHSNNITQNFNGLFQYGKTNTYKKPQEKITYTQPDITNTDEFPQLSEPIPYKNKFPPWMVLSARDADSSFKGSNMFKIVKDLKSKIKISFSEGDVKRQFNGNIVFRIHTQEHYEKVIRIKEIDNIPCEITPHKFLNSSKGVVYSPYFKGQTEDSLLESLDVEGEGILEIKKIFVIDRRKKNTSNENDMETDQPNKKKFDTGKAIITFNHITRPDKVWLGFYWAKVDMYIPPPLRCNKCQSFGHHSKKCRNKAFCAKCDSEDHVDTKDLPCPADTLKCHNCHGSHASFSSQCNHFKKSREITKVKHTQNLEWKDAIKQVEQDPQWANIISIKRNHPPAAADAASSNQSHASSDAHSPPKSPISTSSYTLPTPSISTTSSSNTPPPSTSSTPST